MEQKCDTDPKKKDVKFISNIKVTFHSNYQNMLLLEITTYCISKELSSSVTSENGRVIVVSIETRIFV